MSVALPLKELCGIYAAIHRESLMVYVGSGKDIKWRHITRLHTPAATAKRVEATRKTREQKAMFNIMSMLH